MLVYFLAAVHGLGAAYPPAPTRPSRLDKRLDFNGAASIWSPSLVGTEVTCTLGR